MDRSDKQKLHDTLVRRTSVKAMQSEYIVEKIISHQHKSINKAFKRTHEVEISGFCKFLLSQTKLKKKIKRTEYMLSTFQKKLSSNPEDEEAKSWIEINQRIISELKLKLKDEDRFQGSGRGNKELLFPQGGDQEADRGNLEGENINLQKVSTLLP